jgi:hypothetical protein
MISKQLWIFNVIVDEKPSFCYSSLLMPYNVIIVLVPTSLAQPIFYQKNVCVMVFIAR